MSLTTRQPTGKPSWPILLLAGAEKAGKTYSAAEASASELIGRTLWVGVGEDDPDEYGAIPGARFEIVEHDGTYRSILRALTEAAEEKAGDEPNLIVLDSATRLWDLLCDEQQVVANQRAARKAQQSGRPAPDEDATITMDQWNTAKQRWGHIIDALRNHNGPSIITARLEQVTVLDGSGKPTTQKDWKVKAEKSLPYDVGCIVELPMRGEAYLTGVRSLRFRAEPKERVAYQDFTVEKLWTDLGLAEKDATSPRRHAHLDPTDHAALKAEVWAAAQKSGLDATTLPMHFTEQTGLVLADANEEALRGYLTVLTEGKAA